MSQIPGELGETPVRRCFSTGGFAKTSGVIMLPPLPSPIAKARQWLSDNPPWLFPALLFWIIWTGYEIYSRKALLGGAKIEQSQDPLLFSIVVVAKIIGAVIVLWIAIG